MSNLSASPEVKSKSNGYRQVLSNRNYRHLLSAQFVSDLGDGVYALALLWAMKMLTGSGVAMSLVLAAEIVPMILFGVFAGVLVDRGSKKRIMVYADLFRGVIVGLLAVLWWLELMQPWMLIVAAAALSSFSACFTPARTVTVRTLVPTESIMTAQGLAQTCQTVIGLFAPAIAALLLSVNVAFAFGLNAVSFLVSLLFILLICHDDLTQQKEGKTDLKAIGASMKEGFHTILTVPILRNLLVYMVLLNFMFAPIAVLIPLLAETETHLATFSTLFFLGLLSGSILVGFLGKLPKIVPISAGLLLILAGFGALYFVSNFYLEAALMFVVGLGSPLCNVTLSSLFVVKVPREVLGRAASTVKVLTQIASPVSLSLTASLLVLFNVRDLFLYIAVFGLLIVLAMILNPNIRKAE